MTDEDIDSLRTSINEVDAKLLALLNERADIALRIGAVKSKRGTDVYDPDRERRVIERIDTMNHGPLDKGAIEEVFTAIIAVCRQIQLQGK